MTGLREKDVTLAIAKEIRDTLVASGRVRAALTREDDRYILHRERYGIARRLHADLFISIHCDSAGAGEARGRPPIPCPTWPPTAKPRDWPRARTRRM